MNKDEIVQALQKHQYNQIQADGVANELSQMDSQLIPLLEKWIKDDMDILCKRNYQRSNVLSGELVRGKGKVFISPHEEGRKLQFSRSAFLVSFLK